MFASVGPWYRGDSREEELVADLTALAQGADSPSSDMSCSKPGHLCFISTPAWKEKNEVRDSGRRDAQKRIVDPSTNLRIFDMFNLGFHNSEMREGHGIHSILLYSWMMMLNVFEQTEVRTHTPSPVSVYYHLADRTYDAPLPSSLSQVLTAEERARAATGCPEALQVSPHT